MDGPKDSLDQSKIKKIIDKMKYQSQNVTIDEWNVSYDNRVADLAKVHQSTDLVEFFEKWTLYLKKPDFVSLSNNF